jgi:hypothetical protein
MRGAPVEAKVDLARGRRREDHRADGRRHVVDVAGARAQPTDVELLGPDQADLFLRREDELDARVRTALGDDTSHRFHHRDDGGLVVGAEDGSRRVADEAVVVHDRLDRARGRHGVEVRAEEERRTGRSALDPPVEVPDRRADPRPAVVLVEADAEALELGRDAIGDGTLVPGRARNRGELREQVKG